MSQAAQSKSLFDEAPGYRDAVKRESFIRDSAFIPVTETLHGFEVRQMTLEDFIALRILRSPFLVGGEPGPSDVRAFLWRLSPDYTTRSNWKRWRFMRRCRVFLPPIEPIIKTRWAMRRWAKRTIKALDALGQVMMCIRIYVDDTLQDWGSTKSQKSGETIAYFSDGVAIIGMISREYGWSEQSILQSKMRVLLQYVKEIRQAHGERILFNRSDRILVDHMKEVNHAH